MEGQTASWARSNSSACIVSPVRVTSLPVAAHTDRSRLCRAVGSRRVKESVGVELRGNGFPPFFGFFLVPACPRDAGDSFNFFGNRDGRQAGTPEKPIYMTVRHT